MELSTLNVSYLGNRGVDGLKIISTPYTILRCLCSLVLLKGPSMPRIQRFANMCENC